jgi:hypothetical protein
MGYIPTAAQSKSKSKEQEGIAPREPVLLHSREPVVYPADLSVG